MSTVNTPPFQIRLANGATKSIEELSVGDTLATTDSPQKVVTIRHILPQPPTEAYTVTVSNGVTSFAITLPSTVTVPLNLVREPSVETRFDCVKTSWANQEGIQHRELKTPLELATFCVTTPAAEVPTTGTTHPFTLGQLAGKTSEWFDAWLPTVSEIVDYPRIKTVLDPYLVGYFNGWSKTHLVDLELGSFYENGSGGNGSVTSTVPEELRPYYEIFLSIDPTVDYLHNTLERRLSLLAGVIDGCAQSGHLPSLTVPLVSSVGVSCLGYVCDLARGCGLRSVVERETLLKISSGSMVSVVDLPLRCTSVGGGNGSSGGVVTAPWKIVSVAVADSTQHQHQHQQRRFACDPEKCGILTKEGLVVCLD